MCRALSDLADDYLAGLLGDAADVALVAVGGYGRRELSPGSDLDVVLVHRGRSDVAAIADGVWYPVWDTGVRLDHSVRTVAEVVDVAAADVKAVLGLLDARHVAGDAELTAEVLRRLRQQWRRRAPSALGDLTRAVHDRHRRVGEVAFLLEPDLKEGRGGLRDMAAMRAAAAAWAVDAPGEAARDAYDFLLAVRVELHRRTGRPSDVLLLQDQDAVAAAAGYPDAVALMSGVAGSARTLSYAVDHTMRRVAGWVGSRRRRLARPARPHPVGPGIARHDDQVVLAVGANAVTDATLPLRVAAAAATRGLQMSPATLERLAHDAPAPPQPWPPALRHALIEVLGAGPAGVDALEALDQHGLLVRLLPEWADVRSRSQRNPYHRFTVDRHLCETAANAARLTRDVARPDLLLVAAWLHDIGKGRPGDHTDNGVAIVADVAARMGFDERDVAVLVTLVRHHLLLADVATRRDLDDPATVDTVVTAVGDRTVLDLLVALTEADSLATGPSAWSEWKAGLIAELARRAAARLDGRPADPGPDVAARYADRAASGETVVDVAVDITRVVVVTPDRPGVLWRVAGALALHRLDVRGAVLASRAGTAFQEIAVEPAYGSTPDPTRVADDLRRALAGRIAVDARLAERARSYAVTTPGLPAAPPRVLVDNSASDVATVVEVRTADAVGVLYRIARALSDCAVDVRSAKVATLGPEVVDTFYVTDAAGVKITDREHLGEVERAVLAELSRQ